MHLGHDIIESLHLGYIKPRVFLPLSLARSQANERNLYIYKTHLLCGAHETQHWYEEVLPLATSLWWYITICN